MVIKLKIVDMTMQLAVNLNSSSLSIANTNISILQCTEASIIPTEYSKLEKPKNPNMKNANTGEIISLIKATKLVDFISFLIPLNCKDKPKNIIIKGIVAAAK